MVASSDIPAEFNDLMKSIYDDGASIEQLAVRAAAKTLLDGFDEINRKAKQEMYFRMNRAHKKELSQPGFENRFNDHDFIEHLYDVGIDPTNYPNIDLIILLMNFYLVDAAGSGDVNFGEGDLIDPAKFLNKSFFKPYVFGNPDSFRFGSYDREHTIWMYTVPNAVQSYYKNNFRKELGDYLDEEDYESIDSNLIGVLERFTDVYRDSPDRLAAVTDQNYYAFFIHEYLHYSYKVLLDQVPNSLVTEAFSWFATFEVAEFDLQEFDFGAYNDFDTGELSYLIEMLREKFSRDTGQPLITWIIEMQKKIIISEMSEEEALCFHLLPGELQKMILYFQKAVRDIQQEYGQFLEAGGVDASESYYQKLREQGVRTRLIRDYQERLQDLEENIKQNYSENISEGLKRTLMQEMSQDRLGFKEVSESFNEVVGHELNAVNNVIEDLRHLERDISGHEGFNLERIEKNSSEYVSIENTGDLAINVVVLRKRLELVSKKLEKVYRT